MNADSLLPKRLAARLRAAYAKTDAARSYVAFAEAKILDCSVHLKEYADDPDNFAALHYPSHAKDSYPVQTNIARTHAEALRKMERMPIYLQAVTDAELDMELAERAVLAELARLRASTLGRVAWPPKPRSLEHYRKVSLKEFHQSRDRYRRTILKRHEQHQAEIVRKKQEAEAFEHETNRLMAQALAQMPNDKAAVHSAIFETLKSSLNSGQFGTAQITALASGNQEAFAPILHAAKRLLAGEQETGKGANSDDA